MEEKRIDNETTTIKEKLNKIDNKIDIEKRMTKKMEEMQEDLLTLNKSINRCVELLSVSTSGQTTRNMLNDINYQNKILYQNITSEIDEEMLDSKMRINKLYEEKDNISKENKNEKE